MKSFRIVLAFGIIALVQTGCGSTSSTSNREGITPVSFDGAKYVLTEEPDDAVGVIAARESAQNGEPIVVVGRIGGAVNPWVEGRAAFVLMDASLTVVANGTDSAANEICMDDCCAKERIGSTTLVKVVDKAGQLLPVDARKLFNVAENDMVVVRGFVSKDEKGNFAVLANGIHVRR
jgi:hypothetical protein